MFRVAIVYAIVAWAVIEVTNTVFPRLGLPDWSVTLVVALALVGAPIALVLAWAFDLTPEGVMRTPASSARAPTPALVGLGVVLALGGVGAYAVFGGRGEPRSVASDRSVAVLAFSDLSPERNQEYLADGITEHILTKLGVISGLRVPSRTSVMQYKGTTKHMREIGRELGVAHILEGSVQRDGERVRITAQGPLLLEQADTAGRRHGHRLFPAGARRRSVVCARLRASRRGVRPAHVTVRDGRIAAPREGGGAACARARSVAGRGADGARLRDLALARIAEFAPPDALDELRAAAAAEGSRGVLMVLWQPPDAPMDSGDGSRFALRERALASVLRGDAAEAVRLLDILRERRMLGSAVTELRVDPVYDPLRSDPSFVAFLERLYRNGSRSS